MKTKQPVKLNKPVFIGDKTLNDLLKADLERKKYERKNPTLGEMITWTKMGA